MPLNKNFVIDGLRVVRSAVMQGWFRPANYARPISLLKEDSHQLTFISQGLSSGSRRKSPENEAGLKRLIEQGQNIINGALQDSDPRVTSSQSYVKINPENLHPTFKYLAEQRDRAAGLVGVWITEEAYKTYFKKDFESLNLFQKATSVNDILLPKEVVGVMPAKGKLEHKGNTYIQLTEAMCIELDISKSFQLQGFVSQRSNLLRGGGEVKHAPQKDKAESRIYVSQKTYDKLLQLAEHEKGLRSKESALPAAPLPSHMEEILEGQWNKLRKEVDKAVSKALAENSHETDDRVSFDPSNFPSGGLIMQAMKRQETPVVQEKKEILLPRQSFNQYTVLAGMWLDKFTYNLLKADKTKELLPEELKGIIKTGDLLLQEQLKPEMPSTDLSRSDRSLLPVDPNTAKHEGREYKKITSGDLANFSETAKLLLKQRGREIKAELTDKLGGIGV